MTAVLQRKLAQAQSDQSTSDMTALRALRLSLARAGDALFDLPLAMLGGKQTRVAPDEIADVLSDDDLLMVFDCPGGVAGAISVGLPLVTSLIQQQTMCQVSDRAPDTRPYTDTDAAMCAPLVEDVLRRACDIAEVESDKTCFRGLRFGARGEDVRTVVLGLHAKRYRVFTLTVDIALGLHQAQMVLVLPDAAGDEAERPKTGAERSARTASSPMLDVPVQMDAVLARFQMPLNQLNALKEGDLIPVARKQLDETKLVSISGHVVAQGRLGQLQGNRAVRLMPAAQPPRADPPEQDTEFEPQATPALPAVEPEANLAMSGLDEIGIDLEADALANLSPMEAADQITELAGLTDADLSTPEEDVLSSDSYAAQLPAVPGPAEE